MKKFKITSLHELYEDSYEHGEGQFINSWNQNRTIEAESLEEAIKSYYEKDLNWDWHPESVFIDGDTLMDARLAGEYDTATEKEIEKWKLGKIELYNEHVTIRAWEQIPLSLKELQK